MAPTQEQLIRETHDAVVELQTVLLGIPDTADEGLIGEVKQIKLSVNDLTCRHRKLSNRFWILVGVLVGSGLIGTGIYNLTGG